MPEILLNNDQHVDLWVFQQYLKNHVNLNIDYDTIKDIQKSADIVKQFAENRVSVYGITTAFGEKINVLIPPEMAEELQKNLIITHATGIGEPLSDLEVQAIMLVRVLTLIKGYSGIRSITLEILLWFLKNNVIPFVPSQGSLGASGDLAPLSHIALAVIGLGFARIKGQEGYRTISNSPDLYPTFKDLSTYEDNNNFYNLYSDFQELSNKNPLKLTYKEGLSLINGTAGMTGIALITLKLAKNTIINALIATALSLCALKASSKPFDFEGNELKGHSASLPVVNIITMLIRKCSLIRQQDSIVKVLNHQLDEQGNEGIIQAQEYLQNAYSLRCIPQIVGAVIQTFKDTEKVVIDELNGVDDNPLILGPFDIFAKNVFHGANFHGQYIGFYMDYLKIAMIQLAQLSERRIARLIDAKYNEGLPDLLAPNNSGLQCGLEGLQYTATSLLAEMKMLSAPASIQSIPSNLNNQDVVSMGMVASRYCKKITEMANKIIMVELIASTHAITLRMEQKEKLDEKVGSSVPQRKKIIHEVLGEDIYFFWNTINTFSPAMYYDRYLAPEIDLIESYFKWEQGKPTLIENIEKLLF